MADFGDINLVKRELSFGGSSKVQWAPTAARTLTLPDQTGTIALLSDITGGGGASSGSLRPRAEALTIMTANTVPGLSIAPAANTPVLLIVEEVVEDSLGASPAFTVTGQAIAWSAVNAGYNLPIGAEVVAFYWVEAPASELKAHRPIVSTAASKTFALTDSDTFQDCSNTSAITLTIPAQAAVAWDAGVEIEVARNGAGGVAIVAASGVLLNGVDGNTVVLSAQWRAAGLKRLSTDAWGIYGGVG